MLHLGSIAELASVPGPVHLAIGFFDGVHLGHREVIARAMSLAADDGGSAVIATFDPHPIKVLRPEKAPRLLTSVHHRSIIIERLGAAAMLIIPFDEALSAQNPAEFIASLSAAARPLRSITTGRDWAFGRGRAGNAETLAALGTEFGFEAHAVPPVMVDGEPVSSTRVRLAVEGGDFAGAAKLLGHEYAVLGTVVHGRRLGRTIGFPTANLRLDSEMLPPIGVYAVRTTIGNRLVDGVANLGLRPTVESGAPEKLFEVHLFDFEGDLYGLELEVRFIGRIRDERKFAGLEELKAQIAKDAVQARRILAD